MGFPVDMSTTPLWTDVLTALGTVGVTVIAVSGLLRNALFRSRDQAAKVRAWVTDVGREGSLLEVANDSSGPITDVECYESAVDGWRPVKFHVPPKRVSSVQRQRDIVIDGAKVGVRFLDERGKGWTRDRHGRLRRWVSGDEVSERRNGSVFFKVRRWFNEFRLERWESL